MDEVLPVSARVQAMVQQLAAARAGRAAGAAGGRSRSLPPLDARDLRSRLGLDGAQVVLSISRLVRRKNLDGLMRAFARVRERFPDSRAGDRRRGPERERLESAGDAGPWPGWRVPVRFLGAIAAEQLVEHYNLADVFVLPGRDQRGDVEGFGITLLEAAACERPVIAGRAGGMVDAVADGETGLLVDPGDERALAAGMRRLLASPELAPPAGPGRAGRILRELTWSHCAGACKGCPRRPRPDRSEAASAAGERDVGWRGTATTLARTTLLLTPLQLVLRLAEAAFPLFLAAWFGSSAETDVYVFAATVFTLAGALVFAAYRDSALIPILTELRLRRPARAAARDAARWSCTPPWWPRLGRRWWRRGGGLVPASATRRRCGRWRWR